MTNGGLISALHFSWKDRRQHLPQSLCHLQKTTRQVPVPAPLSAPGAAPLTAPLTAPLDVPPHAVRDISITASINATYLFISIPLYPISASYTYTGQAFSLKCCSGFCHFFMIHSGSSAKNSSGVSPIFFMDFSFRFILLHFHFLVGRYVTEFE